MKPEKKTGGALKRLLVYMKPWWGLLVLITVLSFAGAFLNVMAPNQMKKIVDEIQIGLSGTIQMDKILQDVIVTIALISIALLCNMVQSMISPVISQHTSRKLRREINAKTNRIPLSFYDTTPEGEVLSTMTNDVENIAKQFGNTLPSLLVSGTTLIGCIIIMFLTNWTLALITIIASCVGLFINFILMSKGLAAASGRQDSLAVVNSKVNEAFMGHLVIKAFGAEKEVLGSFRQDNENLRKLTFKSQFFSALIMPVSTFVGNLGYIVVCVVGAALALKGQILVGTIVAFIQYAMQFTNNLSTLAQGAGTISPAIASAARIFAYLDREEMADEGKQTLALDTVKGGVDFEHIRFGYRPEAVIVHDFSCKVAPGKKIAIVGPTGAGKSTLINLLTRFYELNGGCIKIDGVPITEMPREMLHSLISIVLQETWTFEGSIRDNIVYAKQGVSEEQLKTVCEDAGIMTFASTFPNGIDTVLGEACGISAGQKQLITIARAMLDDAPILILDEATSSVDTRTEKLISQAIDKLMEGRTSFVIAHRLSTIKNADLILVLKDGDIIEMGNHNELMAKKGFYSDLYLSQFAH